MTEFDFGSHNPSDCTPEELDAAFAIIDAIGVDHIAGYTSHDRILPLMEINPDRLEGSGVRLMVIDAQHPLPRSLWQLSLGMVEIAGIFDAEDVPDHEVSTRLCEALTTAIRFRRVTEEISGPASGQVQSG